ncbi:hypothetical protein LWI28_017874 [Acer negundo]|uniref:Uncharacterized protein n=1 Tax=Acer negundo TaxID=4023 RepID=A0AAD5NQC2_ACENE|nr:hypothetical protein LWI28_017874 [Acer negundo]
MKFTSHIVFYTVKTRLFDGSSHHYVAKLRSPKSVAFFKRRLVTEKWKVPVNFWEPEFQVDPAFNGLRDLI